MGGYSRRATHRRRGFRLLYGVHGHYTRAQGPFFYVASVHLRLMCAGHSRIRSALHPCAWAPRRSHPARTNCHHYRKLHIRVASTRARCYGTHYVCSRWRLAYCATQRHRTRVRHRSAPRMRLDSGIPRPLCLPATPAATAKGICSAAAASSSGSGNRYYFGSHGEGWIPGCLGCGVWLGLVPWCANTEFSVLGSVHDLFWENVTPKWLFQAQDICVRRVFIKKPASNRFKPKTLHGFILQNLPDVVSEKRQADWLSEAESCLCRAKENFT